MSEALTILSGLVGTVGVYLTWRSIRRQRISAQRPSADQFVRACHREFRYLVEEYGFTAELLAFSGTREPFGYRFRGPKLSVIVQGIQWGSTIDVYLQTGDQEAEWTAELERPRSTNSEDQTAAAVAAWRKRYDELSMRTRLHAHWVLDQRLPGWRLHSTANDQLAQIHDYAAALRSCADDLFSGDLGALPELLASYAEARRQQDSRDQQEMATRIARDIARDAKRPRTLLEQVKIVQGTQSSIGYLRTECRALLRILGKSPEARSHFELVESWRALVERLEAEKAAFTYVQNLEVSSGIVEGLRNAQETAFLVQSALASRESNHFVMELVVALDHQGKELTLALDLGLEALSRE